jgi:hypothetical protein
MLPQKLIRSPLGKPIGISSEFESAKRGPQLRKTEGVLVRRNMLELSDEPLDARIVTFLNEAPVNDGGQFDMAVNILEVSTRSHDPLHESRLNTEPNAQPRRNTVVCLRRSTPRASRHPLRQLWILF